MTHSHIQCIHVNIHLIKMDTGTGKLAYIHTYTKRVHTRPCMHTFTHRHRARVDTHMHTLACTSMDTSGLTEPRRLSHQLLYLHLIFLMCGQGCSCATCLAVTGRRRSTLGSLMLWPLSPPLSGLPLEVLPEPSPSSLTAMLAAGYLGVCSRGRHCPAPATCSGHTVTWLDSSHLTTLLPFLRGP